MSLAKQALATAAALKIADGGGDSSRGQSSTPTTLKEAVISRPITWLIVGGVVAFIGYKIYKKIAKGSTGARDLKQEIKDLKQQEEIQRRAGQVPSYTDYQYQVYADALFVALKGATEDEQDFLPVMKAMKKDIDVTKLIQAFGTRDVSSSWNYFPENHTLPSAIAKYFVDWELEEYVNKPLRSNGVKFQFSI